MIIRVLKSLLASIATCWVLGLVVTQSFSAATYISAIAVMHAVGVGLPLFFVLESRGELRWHHGLLGGIAAGTIPVTAWTLLALIAGIGSNAQATIGNKATIIDGVPTVWFWWHYLSFVAPFALIGGAGGLAFWRAWQGTS